MLVISWFRWPSWPLLPLPQHFTAPDTTAQVWKVAAPTAVTPDVNPETGTGTDESTSVPLPSWPLPLYPQHVAAPDTTAHVCV